MKPANPAMPPNFRTDLGPNGEKPGTPISVMKAMDEFQKRQEQMMQQDPYFRKMQQINGQIEKLPEMQKIRQFQQNMGNRPPTPQEITTMQGMQSALQANPKFKSFQQQGAQGASPPPILPQSQPPMTHGANGLMGMMPGPSIRPGMPQPDMPQPGMSQGRGFEGTLEDSKRFFDQQDARIMADRAMQNPPQLPGPGTGTLQDPYRQTPYVKQPGEEQAVQQFLREAEQRRLESVRKFATQPPMPQQPGMPPGMQNPYAQQNAQIDNLPEIQKLRQFGQSIGNRPLTLQEQQTLDSLQNAVLANPQYQKSRQQGASPPPMLPQSQQPPMPQPPMPRPPVQPPMPQPRPQVLPTPQPQPVGGIMGSMPLAGNPIGGRPPMPSGSMFNDATGPMGPMGGLGALAGKNFGPSALNKSAPMGNPMGGPPIGTSAFGGGSANPAGGLGALAGKPAGIFGTPAPAPTAKPMLGAPAPVAKPMASPPMNKPMVNAPMAKPMAATQNKIAGMKKGGKVSSMSKVSKPSTASSRGDGIAQRGKTRGVMR